MMKKAISILLSALVLVSLCSCKGSQNENITITAMNTLMQIRVFSSNGDSEALKSLEEETKRLEALFDANAQGSDVSRLNASATGCAVSEDTARVIEISKKASKLTDGAFDITVMPVLRLWGFDNGNYGVPKEQDVKNALSLVGSDGISVNGTDVLKAPKTEISLGGIAKGYLGDKLLQIAKENDISAVISLGGNIVLCGENPEKGYWTVGVKNPLKGDGLACSFESKGNLSVVTSGAYERYFEYEGGVYHHIIDTKTGEPAQSDLVSVTVIGENGALCDAFSTALFAMGKEKAVEFAKENNDFEYIFITNQNEIIATEGVANLKTENDAFKISK